MKRSFVSCKYYDTEKLLTNTPLIVTKVLNLFLLFIRCQFIRHFPKAAAPQWVSVLSPAASPVRFHGAARKFLKNSERTLRHSSARIPPTSAGRLGKSSIYRFMTPPQAPMASSRAP